MPATTFVTVWEAARQVQRAAGKTGREFEKWDVKLLAHNRFLPETTTWWLSPTSDNPAYRYGKIVFRTNDDRYIKTPHMFIGLNVEKGIGPSAAPAYTSPAKCRRYIMDREGVWDWHACMEVVASGGFDSTVSLAENEARTHPTVIVAIADVLCGESAKDEDIHDFEVPRGHKQVLQFEYSNGDLSLIGHDTDPPGMRFLNGLDEIRKLSDIEDAIRRIRDLDWTLVDFYVGFHFNFAADATDRRCWNAWEIWNMACYPWREWVWVRFRDGRAAPRLPGV